MRLLSAVRALLVLAVMSPSAIVAQSSQAVLSASVPRLINISGVFRPANGQPAAAVETITLSIYADPEGGAPLWQETQTIALDGQGRYTLLLGATQADGIPAAVFGSSDAQWLGTVFERAGEVERPRVRITSVPYALKASDAETLGGLPASAYLRAPSAGDPARSDVANGDTSLAGTSMEAPGSEAVVLPGTTNFLAKYVNAADVGNSAVFETPTATVPTGAVGIGTTTPADLLHLRFTNLNGGIAGLAVQNLGNTVSSYSGMLFYDQFGALGQFQGFNNVTHEYRINNIATNASINFMTGGVSRFFVAPTGNVGIGTAAPAQKLHVAGNLSVDGQVNAVSQFNINGVRILAASGGNLFVGPGSGAANTSGLGNTFVGSDAGVLNSTGQQNSFLGFEAGAANTVETRNTYFGYGAGRLTTASSNSFFGASAGNANTTGTANVFVGTGAGNGSTTGSQNVFVGAFTGHDSVTTASENVLVGASAGRTNRGSANAFIGKDAGRDNTTGTVNTFLGWSAGEASTSGSSNTFVGASAGTTNVTGGGNTLIGASTDLAASNLTFATAIGSGSVALGSSTIVLGRDLGQDAVHIWGTLRVGLEGAGALEVCRNTNFRLSSCSSSMRYKSQVETYGAGMDVVRRLRPITFTWKSDGARDLGFAAEEVAAIDPLLATYTDEGEIEGVKYRQLTTVLVNAANEQQRLIEQQQKQIDEQQRQIEALLHLVCGQNPAEEFCLQSRAARNR